MIQQCQHHGSGSLWRNLAALQNMACLTCGMPAGPEEDIKPLLEQLKAENVFVRELDTRGLAFHSPVLQPHLGELKEGKHHFATCLHASGIDSHPGQDDFIMRVHASCGIALHGILVYLAQPLSLRLRGSAAHSTGVSCG